MHEELKNRIRNGRLWILNNENDLNYSKANELYCELVDKAISLGLTEEECWNYDPRSVGELRDDEIINLLGGSNG